MDQRNENDSIIPPDSGKWVDCLLLIMRYDCHIHDGCDTAHIDVGPKKLSDQMSISSFMSAPF